MRHDTPSKSNIRGCRNDSIARDKGKRICKKINQGIVDCRDLLSTLLDPPHTGYRYSDYFEKNVVQALSFLAGRDCYDIHDKCVLANALMDRYVPHIYATYFHILNEKSYEWLESFDDDYDFIMVEVNLDKLTNTAIGSGYIGAQMHYVNNILDHRQESFLDLYSATMVSFEPFPNNIDIHAQAIILFNTLAFPLLCREVNEKFTDIEHEFRFIALDLPFVEQSCQHHLFKEISLLGKTGDRVSRSLWSKAAPLIASQQ